MVFRKSLWLWSVLFLFRANFVCVFKNHKKAYEDLAEEDKAFFNGLRCVYDWKVGLPFLNRQAAKGVPGAAEKLAKLSAAGFFRRSSEPLQAFLQNGKLEEF